MWLKDTSGFKGGITNEYVVEILPINGSLRNIEGVNNPDFLYPLVVKRSPGKLIEDQVIISIYDGFKNLVFEKQFRTQLSQTTDLAGGIDLDDLELPNGRYYAQIQWEYDGEVYTNKRYFSIGENISSHINTNKLIAPNIGEIPRSKSIKVIYDKSIPTVVQDYINQLIQEIEPVMREFAGEPIKDSVLTITYDPDGHNSMNNDFTELNIIALPDANKVDTGFDSFFFIEYFHMFHNGKGLPKDYGRYSENISQLMKIVVSNFLKENGIRKTSDKSLFYYTNLFTYVDPLGPNVLVNNGINRGGYLFNDDRTHWEKDSKYQQMMNTFTLDYAISVWMKLFDARYISSGEYDFVYQLQEAINRDQIKNIDDFYNFIDQIIPYTDNEEMKASQWLKHTGLFEELNQEMITVKVLPVKGNLMNISDINNPDIIYPFIVERDGEADIVEAETTISIYDEDMKKIYSEAIRINIGSDHDSYAGLKLQDIELKKGNYYAKVTAMIDGKIYDDIRAFVVD